MTDPITPSLVPGVIGALTAPITKLIETVSGGIGTLYEPKHIVRIAEGEARAAKVRARSDVEVARIRAEGDVELRDFVDQVNKRLEAKELRRQRNIESIAVKAAHQLPESVSDQPVDEDWTVQFFNYAQDVGNEEMQLIWAGILAGEVNQPGVYSLRTLHALRMLRPDDARQFRQLCSYFWRLAPDAGGYLGGTEADKYLEGKDFSLDSFLRLESLGLVIVRGDISIVVGIEHPKEVEYKGRRFGLKAPRNLNHCRIYPFTDVGLELERLSQSEPDWAYCDVVVAAWRNAGITVEQVETQTAP